MTCLAWSPLSPTLLASGEGLGDDGRGGGKIILWDVRQAKSKLRSLDYNDVRGKVRDHGRVAGPAHQGRVLGVVFTGLTRQLALENWHSALGTSHSALCTCHLSLGLATCHLDSALVTWQLALATLHLSLDTRHLALGTRHSALGTRHTALRALQ